MKKYIKSCIIVILAVIGVIGLNFTVIRGSSFLGMFFGKSELLTIYGKEPALCPNYSGLALAGIFEFLALYNFIKVNIQINNKRLKIFSFVTSILLALFLVFGSSIILYSTIKVVFEYIIIYLIKFVGLIIVLYNLVLSIFNKILNFKKEDIEEKSFFTGNIKSFFIVLLVLLLVWSPYFLNHFPGIITGDSNEEIHQILGDKKLTNYNPIVHIGFLAVSLLIGNLFDSITVGIAVNTILQFLIVGSVCSFTIYYLAKKKVDLRIRIFVLLFFGFFPIIPIMNVIIHKDTIYASFMLMSIIVFYELLVNYINLFKSKFKLRIIFSILILVLTALARRNALYAIYASAIFVSLYVFIMRKKYKGYVIKIISLLAITVIFVFTGDKIVSNYTRVPDSWKKYVPAKYNIMLQQVLRAWIDHEDELTENELKVITNFYKKSNKKNIQSFYAPYITDPAMRHGNSIYFKEHKSEFINLYFKLLFKYPMSYIDAIFCTTSGYWDIEESRCSLWPSMYPNDFNVEHNPIHQFYIINFIERMISYQNIPLVGLMFSTALPIWILLILGFFNLYNKKYNLLMMIFPLFLYYGTIFLGPLNGELRYIYCLWMCLPLVIALTFHNMGTNE